MNPRNPSRSISFQLIYNFKKDEKYTYQSDVLFTLTPEQQIQILGLLDHILYNRALFDEPQAITDELSEPAQQDFQRAAREFYQQSLNLWRSLRQNNTLPKGAQGFLSRALAPHPSELNPEARDILCELLKSCCENLTEDGAFPALTGMGKDPSAILSRSLTMLMLSEVHPRIDPSPRQNQR